MPRVEAVLLENGGSTNHNPNPNSRGGMDAVNLFNTLIFASS